MRIDKWLWAVRLYKTRSQATEACRAGHVRVAGHVVKPARPVRAGESISARVGEITRTVRVTGLVENRVGPKLVSQYMEDQTPPEELQKRRERVFPQHGFRPKGQGRPTKKERRALDLLPPL